MQLSTAGSAAVVQTQIVLKVKKVCFAAQESAVRVAAGKNGESVFDTDSRHYAKSRIECIQLADSLDNEFFRSAALQPIIELCIHGGDIDDARALLKHVKTAFIRDKIVYIFPELSVGRSGNPEGYAVAAE